MIMEATHSIAVKLDLPTLRKHAYGFQSTSLKGHAKCLPHTLLIEAYKKQGQIDFLAQQNAQGKMMVHPTRQNVDHARTLLLA